VVLPAGLDPTSESAVEQTTEPILLHNFERGSGLVELAIATDRERRSPTDPPRPLDAAQIALLTMPDGRDIPPSLATWLAYDTLPIFEDGNPAAPRLAWRSFVEMMREQFDGETAETYAGFAKVLTGKCLVLPHGSDSRRFMYAGEPDAHGEYPIFIVDTDDVPWVGLAYPGFDAYVADGKVADVISSTYMDAWEHDHWQPHLADHARRNFAGFKVLDYQEPVHLDGDDAAVAAMSAMLGSAYGDTGDVDADEHGDVDDPDDGQTPLEAAVEAAIEDGPPAGVAKSVDVDVDVDDEGDDEAEVDDDALDAIDLDSETDDPD